MCIFMDVSQPKQQTQWPGPEAHTITVHTPHSLGKPRWKTEAYCNPYEKAASYCPQISTSVFNLVATSILMRAGYSYDYFILISISINDARKYGLNLFLLLAWHNFFHFQFRFSRHAHMCTLNVCALHAHTNTHNHMYEYVYRYIQYRDGRGGTLGWYGPRLHNMRVRGACVWKYEDFS